MPNTHGSAELFQTVSFSTAVYDLDVIKKAAYRFLDRFTPDFCVENDEIVCKLSFTPGTSEAAVQSSLLEFRREVLDQDLRRSIADETSGVRNAILALAFAPSKLLDRE